MEPGSGYMLFRNPLLKTMWSMESGSGPRYVNLKKIKTLAVAGDRTRVTRVTGGNTYHYTTTTWCLLSDFYTMLYYFVTFRTQFNVYCIRKSLIQNNYF